MKVPSEVRAAPWTEAGKGRTIRDDEAPRSPSMSEATELGVRPTSEPGLPERLAWLAWPLFAVVFALAGAGLVFAYLSRGFHQPSNWGTGTLLGIAALTVPFVCSAAVGAFLASRMPRNLIGWLLILVGFGYAATAAGDGYGFYGVVVREPDLPGAVSGRARFAQPALVNGAMGAV